jgi:membrane-associated phospholipid phosphatase
MSAYHPLRHVQLLEDRTTPSALIVSGDLTGDGVSEQFASTVGASGTEIRIVDGRTNQPLAGPLSTFTPFAGFAGAVELAVGDVNNDSLGDLVVAAGTGGAPHVKIYNGADGSFIREFLAFEDSFTGGVFVSAADVNGDGRADVIAGAGVGGGPRVRVFSGASGTIVRDFFAYDSNFRGGTSVVGVDCDLDGFAEIVTGAGVGGGPHVRLFAGATNNELGSFLAYDPNFRGGVFVSCSEFNQDGHPDIVVTPGVGGGPIAERFDGITLQSLGSVVLGDVTARKGARLAAESLADANAVLHWNRVLLQTIRDAALSPPKASRLMAMVHLAQFDAVNAIVGEGAPYLSELPTPSAGASAEAAAASAAYRVLFDQVPTARPKLDAAWNGAAFQHGNDVGYVAGVAFGEAVAARMLAVRANDGANVTTPYTPGTAIGEWQPTPPANAAALLPGWGTVTPFTLTRGDQFRPGPAPDIASTEYATAYADVREIGSKTSTSRTADQTTIAKFWADGGGTVTPPGHWNVIAQQLTQRANESLLQTAQVFATLNAALADAAITSWDVKFTEKFWRPVTAIRAGDTDGNADTIGDATWEPLLTTPPFPGYTSGHSTFSGAAATVLSAFFGDASFRTRSDGLPDATRSFTSFEAAAAEAGKSRIYGGIHFEFDNVAGLSSGRAVGEWTVRTLAPTRREG